MQVTAVVTDEGGRFVSGLSAADFKILDDDRPQTITNFASENIPLELVAAVDVSSSMTAGAADREGVRDEVSGGAAARRSGHRARVQRQHLHAGAAIDGSEPCARRRWRGWRPGEGPRSTTS